MWVGEAVSNLDDLRIKTWHFEPYVVPCPDQSQFKLGNEDDLYLHSVPYMQFPLRIDGRPVTGPRAMAPAANYRRGDDCHWTKHMRNVWRYYRQHPDAPPRYGWWDSFPGRAEGRRRWLHHFDLYRPMVVDGSWAWIDIKETTLFESPTNDDFVASLFVNEETYLVLANYGPEEIEIHCPWTWKDRESGRSAHEHRDCPKDLLFLKRVKS